MLRTVLAAGAMATAGMAFAESHADLENGEKAFKRCVACHVVMDDEGTILAGRRAKSGPNLYGIANRAAGSVDGFRYSKSMVAAGEAGLAWDEEAFVAFVQDPTKYLRSYLDDKKARSKMSLKVRKAQDAADLFAFLSQFGPEPAETAADDGGDSTTDSSN